MRSKLYGASYLKFMYSPVVKVVTSIGGCCVAPARVYSFKITSESMNFPESGNAPSPPSLTVQTPSPPSLTVQAPSPPGLTVQTSDDKSRAVNLPIPESEIEMLSSLHLKAFLFSELKNATKNFYFDNLLGEGGFGYVYQGWLDEKNLTAAKPECGMIVAVKKLKPEGFQGHKEWLSELNYLGQLHHPNLVKLIGYCLDGDNRLLVYEFMPRGSLENHIFKRCAKPLQWATRIKVAIGAARGLLFLHDSESQVIYRDFKASNILLDSDFNAKLSDFGLAKAGPTGDHTHVTTRVMGTHGYAAPEYVATGRLTAKCDVYSFGIVLLELLTGRRAIDKTSHGSEQKLVDWVRSHFTDKRKVFRVMDTKLEGQYPRKGAFMAMALAIHCTHINPKYRPSMDEVLAILEKLPSPKFMNMPPRSTQSRPLSDPSQHDHSLHMKSTQRGCPSPPPAQMKKSQHDQSS